MIYVCILIYVCIFFAMRFIKMFFLCPPYLSSRRLTYRPIENAVSSDSKLNVVLQQYTKLFHELLTLHIQL